MSNKQQKAVEWLINEMQKTYVFNQDDFNMFKQAKELEKQQIIDAWVDGINSLSEIDEKKLAEQFYNETYEQ